jgi:hypothetical protein
VTMVDPVGEPRLAVRLHLFGQPSEEVARVLQGPPPPGILLSVEPERWSEAAAGAAPLGTAVHVLAERLRHRLDLVAFVVDAAEELGWRAALEGDEIVLTTTGTVEDALEALERAGILGPMSKVADVDPATGLPRLEALGEASGRR